MLINADKQRRFNILFLVRVVIKKDADPTDIVNKSQIGIAERYMGSAVILLFPE
ncbi:hypothetical protein QPK24_23095 [Paenibacillus polygoni]|uniref:Uncharacterized protein n=1 Tax=Paenibacillus polygoni TaxID=3050112 RepID=A0ABY8X4K0_9BACL|nr:hypothetical protein [Paenibacillus polygoni]WIV19163.1 hypothetical protein QPK24_23095 [Paenibacillus polygoni]